jgi:hypothetical protein
MKMAMNRAMFGGALSLAVLLGMLLSAMATEVRIVAGEGGSMLQVDGKPFFVKGVTWSMTPVGFKYDYSLWGQPEAIIQATLARDLPIMRTMGLNTVRASVPEAWVETIHRDYGIYTIVNDFCGRYGLTLDGQWVFPTDYSAARTRQHIIATWEDLARRYKDVPGVLLYALGNENNYGLEWKSFEIENLPEGERQTAKARHLYSLFNEVAKAVKAIDPNRPVGIVNGDLQYLGLIAELCPDIDFLGINAYRGRGFGPLFEDVATKAGKPLMFMEIGCDAYNAATRQEDQDAQANYLLGQWREIYRNAAGNGGAGNCLGGVVFQWADEWWKSGQQVRLDIHDTEGSWSHEAYYDAAPGLKNMNEEWFGICGIHRTAIDGVHQVTPRVAVGMLGRIWSVNPFGFGEAGTDKLFAGITAFAGNAAVAGAGAVPSVAAKGKATALPAVIYDDALTALWAPSGHMGNTGAISLDPKCTENPAVGTACLKVTYGAADNWGGVVWQDPANDWGDQPGGYDLTGAKAIVFRARGAKGGEKVKFSFGLLGADKPHHDTAKGEIEAVLGTDWQEFRIPLDGKDLSCIKTGFCWVLAGQGAPVVFFLDQIVFE